MTKATPSFHLYAAARGNAEAAKMIQLSPYYPSKAVQVHLPLSNGVALSMELHLKAWLSHQGVPEAQFSAPNMRHNIQGLLALAVSHGLSGLHPQTFQMAETIGPFYKGHEYRYLPEGVTMPTLNYPLVFAVLDVLDSKVRYAIDAEGQAAKALESEAASKS